MRRDLLRHDDVAVAAVEEAIAKYGPPGIMNTDQGSQFTSGDFIVFLLDVDLAAIAAVALASGLNANLLRRWVVTEEQIPPVTPTKTADVALPPPSVENRMFIPVPLEKSTGATAQAITIELRRGAKRSVRAAAPALGGSRAARTQHEVAMPGLALGWSIRKEKGGADDKSPDVGLRRPLSFQPTAGRISVVAWPRSVLLSPAGNVLIRQSAICTRLT